MKTLICLIIDESGSMEKNRSEITRGYNNFIGQQLKIREEAKFYLIKFNNVVRVLCINEPLSKVPTMTNTMYVPKGGTALYDAILEAVKQVDKYKKRDERVVCVIMTDGEDNHSYATESDIKELIESRTSRGDWSFVYIGECAEEFAHKMGISPQNACDFLHDNVTENFERASIAVSTLRSNQGRSSSNLLDFI